MNPLLIILAASIAANAVLAWAWLDERDDSTAAEIHRDQARADASACSDATEALRELAEKRAKAAAPARAAAAATARTHQQRADFTLGLQPKQPLDMCGSMKALGDEWLAGRLQK